MNKILIMNITFSVLHGQNTAMKYTITYQNYP